MILHCMGDDYRDEAKIWSAAMWTCGSCSAIAWQGKRGIYGICTKIYHIIMIRLLLMFSPKFAVHFAFFCLRTMLDVSEPNFWDTPKRAFWCPEECALEAKINKVREKEPMVFQRCDGWLFRQVIHAKTQAVDIVDMGIWSIFQGSRMDRYCILV